MELNAHSVRAGEGLDLRSGRYWVGFCVAAVMALAGCASVDPAPPISGHTNRAQKTSFGIAIKKMRDRVFRVGDLTLRLVQAGTFSAGRQMAAEGFGATVASAIGLAKPRSV